MESSKPAFGGEQWNEGFRRYKKAIRAPQIKKVTLQELSPHARELMSELIQQFNADGGHTPRIGFAGAKRAFPLVPRGAAEVAHR